MLRRDQLQLERGAVVAGAEQHRLALEQHAGFALRQHLVGDPARLLGVVAHADQLRHARRVRGRSTASWRSARGASAMTALQARRIGWLER